MTIRSTILGFLCAASIGILSYYNDYVLRQTKIAGSYFPIFIYGMLLLFVLCLNPLLKRINWAFSGRELAFTFAIILPACYVGSRSFIHHFPDILMHTQVENRTNLAWQKRHLIRRLPPKVIAGVRADYRKNDIKDPSALQKKVQELNTMDTAAAQKASKALTDFPDNLKGQLKALNRIINDAVFFQESDYTRERLGSRGKLILDSGFQNSEEPYRLNRHQLDALLDDQVVPLELREDQFLNAYASGVGNDAENIALSDVPWHGWARPLYGFWLPFMGVLVIGFLGLAVVVKRHWIEHEHIPFPIAAFAETLMPDEDGAMNPIFKNKLFWSVAGFILFIHMNNYIAAYGDWKAIPLRLDFTSFHDQYQILQVGNAKMLLMPWIFFSIVGFAYFIGKDVSFSIGIGPWVYCIISGLLIMYFNFNMNVGGDYNSLRYNNFIKCGSFFGLFLVMFYVGRHYYFSVIKESFGMKGSQEVRQHERWGFRIFLICAVIAIGLLVHMGIALQWAIFYVTVTVISYIVVSRVVAETGMIMVHPMILPVILIWGFFGTQVMTSQQMLLLMFLGAVMDFSCHIGIMPMMLHSLKISREKPMRLLTVTGFAVLTSMFLASSFAIYCFYNEGALKLEDGWTKRLAQKPFEQIVKEEDRLEAQGQLQEQYDKSFFEAASPEKITILVFLISMGLVIGTEFCRLRIRSWPIHPVFFIATAFWYARILAASFLVGWVIKALVIKYGGARVYNQLKPAMLGMIAGELLSAMIVILYGWAYNLITGLDPAVYQIIPA